MTEHPILLSTEGVRAILDGRKTQTRRIIKFESLPTWEIDCLVRNAVYFRLINRPDIASHRVECPYGQVGDRLYIKESYRVCNMDMDRKQALMVHYYSDRTYESVVITNAEMKLWKARKKPFAKTSGRFMYKSLARIFLEITNIRVERAQEINLADIKAEGLSIDRKFQETKDAWINLWDSINAKRGYGWDKNPFAWVVEFKQLPERK